MKRTTDQTISKKIDDLILEKNSMELLDLIQTTTTETYEQRQSRINSAGGKYNFADICEAAGHLGAEYGHDYGDHGQSVPKDIISSNYLSWAQRILKRLQQNNGKISEPVEVQNVER